MAAVPPEAPSALEVGYWDIRGLGAPLRMMCEFASVDYNPKIYGLTAKEGDGWDASAWFDVKPVLKKKLSLIHI